MFTFFLFSTPALGSEFCFERPQGFLEYLSLPGKICLSSVVIEQMKFEEELSWNYAADEVQELKIFKSSKTKIDGSIDGRGIDVNPRLEISNRYILVELARYEYPAESFLRAVLFINRLQGKSLVGPYNIDELAKIYIVSGSNFSGYSPNLRYKRIEN